MKKPVTRIPHDWRKDYYNLNTNPKHLRERETKSRSENTKYCPGCEKTLEKTFFGVNQNRYDGVQPYCRSCHRTQQRHHMAKVRKTKAKD